MNQAVFNFIAAQNLSENECIQQFGFWIGLGDKDKEGQYVWDDGTSLCSTLFTDWAKKEPNNNEKKDVNGQDCVQLWYRQRTKDMWGKWDDEYCAFREKGFICEYTIPYCDYTTYFGGIQPNPCPQTTVTLP
ncbi:hepatic lectin-like [Glandiceps talaboti]